MDKIAMYLRFKISLILMLLGYCLGQSAVKPNLPINWEDIASIEQDEFSGISGSFFGFHNGAFIIAGGDLSGFLDLDTKASNQIIVIEKTDYGYDIFSDFYLKEPISFGISTTTPYGVICAGGTAKNSISMDAFLIRWDPENKQISFESLPALPEPVINGAAAVIGHTVYLSGGYKDNLNYENRLWSLDLSNLPKSSALDWIEIENIDSNLEIAATAVQHDGFDNCIYIFGTERGLNDNTVKVYKFSPQKFRTALRERKDTSQAWSSCASIEIDKVISPIALCYGDSHIAMLNKDKILLYHTVTDTWIDAGRSEREGVIVNALSDCDKITLLTHNSDSIKISAMSFMSPKGLFGWLNASVLVGYLVFLFLVGFFYARKKKTAINYFEGGKKIPWWAAGLSIFGTQLSAIAFMAIPAKVYASDWLYFVGVITIAMVQPIVIYLYLPFFRKLNVASAYEYLEKRFNLFTRMIACVSFILFQIGRMTIVLFLPALALSAVTGMNIYLCIILMGAVVTFYTMSGGIEAVIWTDVLQVIILVGAGLTSLIIVVNSLSGGFRELWQISTDDNKLKFIDWSWDYTRAAIWIIFIGGIFQNIISYTADQAVVQRYMVTKDIKSATNSIWSNAVLVIPVSMIWFSIGTALYCFYKANPAQLDPTVKTDQIFPLFVAQQLPVGIVGLVIAGLFAAAQSTVSSSMNSISTVISTDFYQRFSKNYNEQIAVKIAVICSLVLGILSTSIAIWMAANQGLIISLWDIYIAVIGLLMAGVAGLFALGIFTERANASGAVVGVLCGVLILFLFQKYTDIHFYIYAFIGIAACFLIGYTSSLFLPSPEKSSLGLTLYTVGDKEKRDIL